MKGERSVHPTTELKLCKEWFHDTWTEVHVDLVRRAYAAKPNDLALLAKGRSRQHLSTCCKATARAVPTRTDLRYCARCLNLCRSRVVRETPPWPAAWHWLYTPRTSWHHKWVEYDAAVVAKECDLLLYQSDEIALLIGLNDKDCDTFFERHWLPLYRWEQRTLKELQAPLRAALRGPSRAASK